MVVSGEGEKECIIVERVREGQREMGSERESPQGYRTVCHECKLERDKSTLFLKLLCYYNNHFCPLFCVLFSFFFFCSLSFKAS